MGRKATSWAKLRAHVRSRKDATYVEYLIKVPPEIAEEFTDVKLQCRMTGNWGFLFIREDANE